MVVSAHENEYTDAYSTYVAYYFPIRYTNLLYLKIF